MKKYLILLLAIVLLTSSCHTGSSNFEKLTLTQVVKAFGDARLPHNQLQFFTAASDPAQLLGKPNQYTEKVTWQTTDDVVHTILAFDNEADLQAAKTQLEAEAQAAAPNSDYIYVHKNVLLRLNYQLYLRTAAIYKKVLTSL